MRKISIPRFSVALLLLPVTIIIIGVAAIIYFVTSAGDPPTPLTLAGDVSLDKARAEGLVLTVPEDETPEISAEEARESARRSGGPGEVLEVVLAQAVDTRAGRHLDRLTWVVHYDPNTIPISGEEGEYITLWLGFVDAMTGEFVDGYGEAGSCEDNPPPEAPCPD